MVELSISNEELKREISKFAQVNLRRQPTALNLSNNQQQALQKLKQATQLLVSFLIIY